MGRAKHVQDLASGVGVESSRPRAARQLDIELKRRLEGIRRPSSVHRLERKEGERVLEGAISDRWAAVRDADRERCAFGPCREIQGQPFTHDYWRFADDGQRTGTGGRLDTDVAENADGALPGLADVEADVPAPSRLAQFSHGFSQGNGSAVLHSAPDRSSDRMIWFGNSPVLVFDGPRLYLPSDASRGRGSVWKQTKALTYSDGIAPGEACDADRTLANWRTSAVRTQVESCTDVVAATASLSGATAASPTSH